MWAQQAHPFISGSAASPAWVIRIELVWGASEASTLASASFLRFRIKTYCMCERARSTPFLYLCVCLSTCSTGRFSDIATRQWSSCSCWCSASPQSCSASSSVSFSHELIWLPPAVDLSTSSSTCPMSSVTPGETSWPSGPSSPRWVWVSVCFFSNPTCCHCCCHGNNPSDVIITLLHRYERKSSTSSSVCLNDRLMSHRMCPLLLFIQYKHSFLLDSHSNTFNCPKVKLDRTNLS